VRLGVRQLLGSQGLEQVAFLRRRVEDRDDLDHLARVRVEGLHLALGDADLVAVLEAKDDERIVQVDVRLAKLGTSGWHMRSRE
jgi:uncharacterized protein with GYD domain